MFRARTLCGLGLALVIVVVLVWRQLPAAAGPPDDGKERPTAELILGTWTYVSSSRGKPYWWSSRRIEYHADGTYRSSSNKSLLVLWLTGREGRYELTGTVIRHHYDLTPQDEADNRSWAPGVLFPGWWDNEIISVSRDQLTVVSSSGSTRDELVYRRTK
jgi:hypothetical protein